jgi:hypothetical protein
MTVIPIQEKTIEFRTDLGVVVRASRAYVHIELLDGKSVWSQRLAMIDTAAPWSVLPCWLWQDLNLSWQPLGSQLTREGKADVSALTWCGVPCQLGETRVVLVHPPTNVRSRPLRLLAKFALARVASPIEKEALLGHSFVIDNSLALSMKGVAGLLQASLTVD